MHSEDESDLTGAAPRRRPKPSVIEVGGRKLKPSTLMMGHGFDPALSEGSLKPPIFLTSTFVFENAAAGKRHFEGVTASVRVARRASSIPASTAPTRDPRGPARPLGGRRGRAFLLLGMSAIATLLLTFVQPGDVIVHSGPLYAATETLIGRFLGRFGVKWLDFPAGAERHEIEAVLERAKAGGRVPLIYLRARPTRPTRWWTSRPWRRRAQPSSATSARRSRSTTPSWGRSGTTRSITARTSRSIRSPNMRAGIADLVAGGVVGAKALINPIRMMRNTIGTITDPNSAWMLLRSLETLELAHDRPARTPPRSAPFFQRSPEGRRASAISGFLKDDRQADILPPPLAPAPASTFSLLPEGRRARGVRIPRRAARSPSSPSASAARDACERARRR
jgi:methionine-gamma-lyase